MSSRSRQPVCLTIAGLDPSGGAGVLADIKTFRAFGCFGTAAVSSLTFQNTQGVFGTVHQTAESLRSQAQPVIDDFDIAGLKTGMLPTAEVIEETARLIGDNSLGNLVVDPVVRSTSGYDLIDDGALTVLVTRLFPLADLVTPNIPEAERITRRSIETEQDIIVAAEIIRSLGARNVLIKGGHLPGRETRDARSATDYLFLGDDLTTIEGPFYDTTATHGTGCTLAAAITANLALGRSLIDAVRTAKRFVANAIKTAPMLGHGNSPINI